MLGWLVHLAAVVAVAIVAHEGAHALAARAVGHELFEIQVGAGPIGAFRIGSVDIRVGPVPLGGSVQSGSPSPHGFRWRAGVVAGAGPAANVILAVAGVAAGDRAVVVFNGFAVAANLWPGRRPRHGEAASDGRILLAMATGDADAVAEERSAWWTARASRQRMAGDMTGALTTVADGVAEVGETRSLLAMGGVVAFEQQRFGAVVDAYARLIDDDGVSVASRAAFASDAAWAACLADDDRYRGLAEPWAALGRRLEPGDRRRRVIHGLALVDADRSDEALALVAGLDDPIAAAVTALALAASGDLTAARALRIAAVDGTLAPGHPLHRRLDAALDDAG